MERHVDVSPRLRGLKCQKTEVLIQCGDVLVDAGSCTFRYVCIFCRAESASQSVHFMSIINTAELMKLLQTNLMLKHETEQCYEKPQETVKWKG